MTEGGVVIEENTASDVFVVWEEKKDCPGEDADIISTVQREPHKEKKALRQNIH